MHATRLLGLLFLGLCSRKELQQVPGRSTAQNAEKDVVHSKATADRAQKTVWVQPEDNTASIIHRKSRYNKIHIQAQLELLVLAKRLRAARRAGKWRPLHCFCKEWR